MNNDNLPPMPDRPDDDERPERPQFTQISDSEYQSLRSQAISEKAAERVETVQSDGISPDQRGQRD